MDQGLDRPDRVSLKEHLESRMTALDQRLQKEMAAVEKATLLAAEGLGDRLDLMSADIRTVLTFMNQMKGMASQRSVNAALLFSVIGALLGIAGIVMGMMR